MIKISTIVSDIVYSSEFALKGMQIGCLNMSAYAERIQSRVEQRAKKPVTKSSIVIALSRLADEVKEVPSLTPKVHIKNLSSTTGLFEVVYNAGPNTRQKLLSLSDANTFESDDYISIGLGISEASIVTGSKHKEYVLNELKQSKPRLVVDDLAALTVHISPETYQRPNIIYAFTKILAVKRVNIHGFRASFSELTFIIKEKDLKDTYVVFHDNFLVGEPATS